MPPGCGERQAAAHTERPYPARAPVSLQVLGGLRISEECALPRGGVNLGTDAINVGRSKTEAGYREVDVIFAALHEDLSDHLARPTAFDGAADPLFASASGRALSTNNVRQRVVQKSVVLANGLLRERGFPRSSIAPRTRCGVPTSAYCWRRAAIPPT